MSDSVKIQIVVNGKVAVERELVEKDTIQYQVGKADDGKMVHACTLIELREGVMRHLPLLKPTTIDDA